MPWISEADYETVTVECEHCGADCVFNRREDLPDVGPIAGENVMCRSCAGEFRMVGGTINPPYEIFTFAAREHFHSKRYMQAVASMAQAWELFFTTFAAAHYIYRPFFALNQCDRDIDDLNSLLARLDTKTNRFTFAPLPNLLINTIAHGVTPTNLADAAAAIERISSGMGNDPPQALRSGIADPAIRQLLDDLLGLTAGSLRNNVLHHRAYRPLRSEAEQCVEGEVDVLYRAKHTFRVATFEEFRPASSRSGR